jgi:endonuclease-3 related protein
MPPLARWFQALLEHYGRQAWWPGETTFEIMLGAVLVQRTTWAQTERALNALRAANALSPPGLRALSLTEIEACVKPAGFFRLKARRLLDLVGLVEAHGGLDALKACSTEA